jgi:hypothetical protein
MDELIQADVGQWIVYSQAILEGPSVLEGKDIGPKIICARTDLNEFGCLCPLQIRVCDGFYRPH